MIVPMKKIALLFQAKDADSALKVLGSLGVVHVEHQALPQGKNLSLLQEDLASITEAMRILSGAASADKIKAEALSQQDWRFFCRHIIDLNKRLAQLEEYSRHLQSAINQWQAWGDFDPSRVEQLARKNIFVRLYQIPKSELKQIPAGVIIEKLFISGGVIHCAIISRQKLELPFKEIIPPKTGLAEMRARLSEDQEVMQGIKQELRKFSASLAWLKPVQESLKKELEFCEALNGMGQAGEIKYLTGYIPFDSAEELSRAAKKEKWGLYIDNPGSEDRVPTLLRTPRWVALIKPVLRLLEVLPGYQELDVSLPFFLFFSLFFGILIGDAGYGLVYALLTVWLQKKFSHKLPDKSVFFLLYVLSSCAIIWGLLTGSFFGQSWLHNLGFRPLLPALNDSKTMQALCFFLGALHLSIAHGWRAILKAPSLTALVDVGWIAVLWSAFFFARMLILGEALPVFVMNLLWGGIALVILFTNPQKNMFKGIGEGLGAVALSLMNNFTDVVSYVRLFAVGMAGLAIAETANSMAGAFAGEGVFSVIARVAIVIVGHSLNIILGPISVLVHGVRLNVLEFSGHASITWSGIAYRPLRE